MTDVARYPITIDEYLDLMLRLDEVALSPDGQLALVVAGGGYHEQDKRAPRAIMAVPVEGGAARPFSAGAAVDRKPHWSPDGTTVAFLSDRPHDLPAQAHAAATQVYLLPRDGGEARRLTAVAGAIHDLAWTPDGTRLVLLMTQPQSDEERRRDEERAGAFDVEERPQFWRLWTADLRSGAVVPLTPDNVQVWEFALAPDGQSAALIVSDQPYEWSWFNARLAVAALDGSAPRTIHATDRQLAHPRFAPDGATVAVLSCMWSDRGNNGGDILLVPVGEGQVRNLIAPHQRSVYWIEWERDGRTLLASGYEQGEGALWRCRLDGTSATLWRAQAAIVADQMSFSRAGDTVAMLCMDPSAPPELWVGRLEDDRLAERRCLTAFHARTGRWELGTLEVVHWTASDGTTIQGLLGLPTGYREGTRLPLVINLHGGPAGLTCWDFAGRATPLLNARGFAVLLPNPRGSLGWGAPFTEANLGDMGGADFGDIMAGVDHLIARGIADPERLGIRGGSYGGFMVAWAITQTARFKAAVMSCGIVDWRSFHGVSVLNTWDAIFYGPPGQPADAYDLAGPHARFSPLAYIDRVSTPTLILHGAADELVPVSQGYQFLRALRDHNVPSRLTVYPRAGHGFSERAHERDALTQTLDWFTTYLVPVTDP
jgi:dipeptidyl aminopeptidase/acylaminoacyl peptidase